MKYQNIFAMIVSATFLAACGGGGGGGENSDGAIPPITETPTEPSTPIEVTNYSGKWTGNYYGGVFYYDVVQTGNDIVLTNSTPGLPPGQKYKGSIIENSAVVFQNDYVNTSSSKLIFINPTTITATQNNCTANPGYVCLVANNIPITFTLMPATK